MTARGESAVISRIARRSPLSQIPARREIRRRAGVLAFGPAEISKRVAIAPGVIGFIALAGAPTMAAVGGA